MKNKKGLIALVAMLGIVLITVGATYAWFSYSKSGTKENTISSGAITFHYEEGAQGLSLDDAMPMTDEYGMIQNKYFDFTITSKTSNTVEIPYYITVRRSTGSETTLDSHVKVYLTKVTGEGNNEQETPVELAANQTVLKFSELGTYTNNSIQIPASEKALYTDTVPVNSSNYNVKYRLRMWLDQNTNFSPVEVITQEAYCTEDTGNTTVAEIEGVAATIENCKDGYTWHPAVTETQYPYNNKTYTLTVNVYGEGQAASAAPSIQPLNQIPSCPDCVYAYTTDLWYYSADNEDNAPVTTLTSNQYKADYQDLVEETGKNYFLGFKLDNSGTIEKAYACGIKDGIPFCIEGSMDGSTYNDNVTLLQSASLYNNTCTFYDRVLACYGSVNAGLLKNNGYASVTADSNHSCEVYNTGSTQCKEQ